MTVRSRDWVRLRRHDRAGFTIFEVIISLLVVALLTLVVVNVFVGVNQFNRAEQSRILVGDQATRLFANLDATLRQGKAILSSATVGGTLYTTSSTTLVITLPSLVAGQPSASTVDTVAVTLNSASGQLTAISAPDPSSSRPSGTTLLMTSVSDIYFRYTTDDPTQSTAVTVVTIVGSTTNQRTFLQPAILYATLRNHP